MAAITINAVPGVVAGIAKLNVIESIEQATLIAAVAIAAGQAVAIDTNGKFALALATTAANAALFYGIATSSAAAGQAVTAIAQGVVDGFTISDPYGSAVLLSDTPGAVSGVTGGTSVKTVGQVMPVRIHQPGGSPTKCIRLKVA